MKTSSPWFMAGIACLLFGMLSRFVLPMMPGAAPFAQLILGLLLGAALAFLIVALADSRRGSGA